VMNDLPLPGWLLRWLSVDVESLEGGTARLRLARFPEGEWGLLALIAVAAAFAVIAAIYLREGRIPTWRKMAMAAVRCLLVLLAACVLFYPVLEVNRARDLKATTLVLLDDSLSMGIRDRYQSAPELRDPLAALLAVEPQRLGETSRADIVTRVLGAGEAKLLRDLRERNLLKVYTFSDQLRPVASGPQTGAAGAGEAAGAEGPGPAPPVPPADPGAAAGGEAAPAEDAPLPVPRIALEPRGTVTDLAGALRAAVDQQGGTRVAAAVVFSDGRLTAGESVAGIAEFLRRRSIPVHAVGVGDPTPPRNFRLTAVLASERVFAGDPITADVRVRQEGFDGETVRVELVDRFLPLGGSAEEAPRTIDSADLTFAEGQGEATAHFSLPVEGLGRHRLTARIEPRPEETFLDDNSRSADVEVIKEASKVLLIAGAPTWEYRFLKNILLRDKRIFLAGWLLSADADFPQEGNTSLKALPRDAKELFEYDVVLLLDVDPEGLPPGYPELLEQFVGKHRGGLLYLAGEKYSISFFHSQAMRPIADMLPVVADLSRAEGERSRAPFHEKDWPLSPTRAASTHAATRLSSHPERNRERWEEISSVYWSFPVRKAKPGATVLLEHADPGRAVEGKLQPVLAWQFYEGGRVIFMGTDETWRWRATTEDVYDQFWIQTVRYLTETRLSGGKRQILQTDSEVYGLGDVVRVSALLMDESYKPLEIESQSVVIEHPDGSTSELELKPDSSAPGWYRGVFVPRSLNDYRLLIPGGAETAMRVEPPDLEFQVPRLDEESLQALAEGTAGSYSRIWEAASVPERIPDRRQTVITTDDPVTLWDNWVSMALLAGLLTLEWILRKLNRLL
ncbi:MAG: hypothetical protein JXA90_13080, partial [Planctomycetes bacterium]|nr:hypothetical protein [Planctomycetota bacterium]